MGTRRFTSALGSSGRNTYAKTVITTFIPSSSYHARQPMNTITLVATTIAIASGISDCQHSFSTWS